MRWTLVVATALLAIGAYGWAYDECTAEKKICLASAKAEKQYWEHEICTGDDFAYMLDCYWEQSDSIASCGPEDADFCIRRAKKNWRLCSKEARGLRKECKAWEKAEYELAKDDCRELYRECTEE